MTYKKTHGTKARDQAAQKPGDLISVILNEDARYGSKMQFCANLPEHSEISSFTTKSELREEYDARTSGNQFKRIGNLGLIGHLPKLSEPNHHPMVNPDMRFDLIKAAENPYTHFEVPGLSEEDTGDLDRSREKELEFFDWMETFSADGRDAITWYVGREIDRDNLKDPDDAGYSDLGLRAHVFTQIVIFLADWKDTEPEIQFSEFTMKSGTKHNGYSIVGEFTSNDLTLKPQDEIDIAVPTKKALEDWIQATLLTFFKYSSFEPADTSDKDVRNEDIGIGDGELKYSDLTTEQDDTYEDMSFQDAEDHAMFYLMQRLETDATVNVDENAIDFELTVTSSDKY